MPSAPRLVRVVATLMAIAAAVLAFIILWLPGAQWHRSWPNVLACLATAAFVVVAGKANAACRLTVDDRGIRFDSGSRTTWAYRSWAIDWKDIVHVMANPALGMVQIRGKGGLTSRRILVRQWLPAESTAGSGGKLFARRDPTQSELWLELKARGLFDPERFGAGRNVSDFDMAKHPATRWALVVAVVLGAYGIVDLGVDRQPKYFVASAVSAAFAAAVTFMLVLRARRPYPVPVSVTAIVALLMAGASLLAVWAALSHWA